MLICEKCGNTYTVENAKVKSQHLCDIDGERVVEQTLVCRQCDRLLVEAKICPACERVYIFEDEDICRNCYEEAQGLDTCLEIGNADYNPVSLGINGFLAMVYEKEEIEKILLNDFKNLSTSKQEEYIKEYLESDLGYLADWLAEKRKKHNANLH